MNKYQALKDALAAGPTKGTWRKATTADVMIGTRRLCKVNAAEALSIGADVDRQNVNAAYIAAANPATIGSLLADLEMAEKALEGMLNMHHEGASLHGLVGPTVAAAEAALSQIKGQT